MSAAPAIVIFTVVKAIVTTLTFPPGIAVMGAIVVIEAFAITNAIVIPFAINLVTTINMLVKPIMAVMSMIIMQLMMIDFEMNGRGAVATAAEPDNLVPRQENEYARRLSSETRPPST
jgi:hypothetical protein